MPDNVIPIPDDFNPVSAPRDYPLYLFVVDNEVALTLELLPTMDNFELLNALFSSDPKIIPSWERVPDGYIYDPKTGKFSAPE